MENATLIGRFNHRIMLADVSEVELYKLVNVYYDLDGTPTDYTDALGGGCGCIEGLYGEAIEMLEAFSRPVLMESEIDFSRSILEKEDQMIGRVYQEKLED
jgi:hypothetical protein